MQVSELQLSLPYKSKVKAMNKQSALIVLILFTTFAAVLLLGQKEEIKEAKKQYEAASEKLEIYKAAYRLKVDQLRECEAGEVTIKTNQK